MDSHKILCSKKSWTVSWYPVYGTNELEWFAGIDWRVGGTYSSGKINRSLATLLILRGHDLHKTNAASFLEPHLYTSWMPPDETCKQWVHPRPFCNYNRSAVLLSNSMSVVNPMVNLMEKAWSMFASRAYVHQYTKHGLTEDDFLDSFAGLEQIIANYKKLWKVWFTTETYYVCKTRIIKGPSVRFFHLVQTHFIKN